MTPSGTAKHPANGKQPKKHAAPPKSPPQEKAGAKEPPRRAGQFKLDARPDSLDFRDKLYVPTLVEVPTRRPLDDFRRYAVPVLDQGQEGACTGFGLAAVAHYLLRARHDEPDLNDVCPRMFYEMARRYDEWPGEAYEGSSARGAMKGWYHHGVCAEALWPYVPGATPGQGETLTPERLADALKRPLGAYFRVNHQDIIAMHSALAEVGVLYATAMVHQGWMDVKKDGMIPLAGETLGGHAFAIVAYDERGFWIQNSWREDWGKGGFAQISYDDWLQNGSDVWVARLGAPVNLHRRGAVALSRTATAGSESFFAQATLRPHIITLGNDGAPCPTGPFGNTPEVVQDIFKTAFPAITKAWKKKKRLLLYAHGGLVGEDAAIQRVADYYEPLLGSQVYPLSFIWKSDYWTTLTNILKEAMARRSPEQAVGGWLDFMLDRLDDALEPLARALSGKAQWDEMKENALAATTSEKGGALLAARELDALLKSDDKVELHLVGHSAGSIFLAPLAQLLATRGEIARGPMKGKKGLGHPIKSLTLWAPACTMDLFEQAYRPLIEGGRIEQCALFTLNDRAERDDHCGNIYHKSLLYLVANAFEARARVPWVREEGWPILGLEKFIRQNGGLMKLIKAGKIDWILAPNTEAEGSPSQSRASAHGAFDDDPATVKATLRRILGDGAPSQHFSFRPSASALRDWRQAAMR